MVFEALGTIYTKCCATCKHWDQFAQEGVEHMGICTVLPASGTGGDAKSKGGLSPVYGVPWRPHTTDLSLCSKWEDNGSNTEV